VTETPEKAPGERRLSSLYVPIAVTIALLVSVASLAATVWSIAAQRARWASEDERNAPRFTIRISTDVRQEQFRLGYLTLLNPRPFDHMQLLRIAADAPSDLVFTEVTNLPRWTLRSEPRRSLDIPVVNLPPNGSYAVVIALRTDRTPQSDQGQVIELAAEIIELSATTRTWRRVARSAIPEEASKY
jgi:hypothetical protein